MSDKHPYRYEDNHGLVVDFGEEALAHMGSVGEAVGSRVRGETSSGKTFVNPDDLREAVLALPTGLFTLVSR